MNSFFSDSELKGLGLKKVGKNVLVSVKCSIYGAENIEIGDNVRVDDFSILSGKIVLHDYIHIAAYTALFGGSAGIEINSFSTISSRGAVYAISDDYSGKTMTNPMVADEYRGVIEEHVAIGRHVVIGTGTTVLPGVKIGTGVAVGAMSLVLKDLAEWGIYAGIPCKYIKDRKKDLLLLEKDAVRDKKQ